MTWGPVRVTVDATGDVAAQVGAAVTAQISTLVATANKLSPVDLSAALALAAARVKSLGAASARVTLVGHQALGLDEVRVRVQRLA